MLDDLLNDGNKFRGHVENRKMTEMLKQRPTVHGLGVGDQWKLFEDDDYQSNSLEL